jgi:hypothetical protein
LVAEMAFLALEFPVLQHFVGHGVVVDRQEEIGVQIVGRGDALDQAGPGLALGHEQLGLSKAFGLQFLLDALCKAQIEVEFGDVAGAGRAFRFSGMSHIQNDPEICGIACRCVRSQSGRAQGRRPQGS